jgi:hypothetical protein
LFSNSSVGFSLISLIHQYVVTNLQPLPVNPETQQKKRTGLIIGFASAAAVVVLTVALTAISILKWREKASHNPKDNCETQADKIATKDDGVYFEIDWENLDESSQHGQTFDDPTVGVSTVKCSTEYENHLRGKITHTRRSPVTQKIVDEIVISEEGIERTPPFKDLKSRTQEGNTARSLPEGALHPNVQRDFETACYSVDEGFLDEINAPPECNKARSLPEATLNPKVRRDFETACYSVDEEFLDEITAPPESLRK